MAFTRFANMPTNWNLWRCFVGNAFMHSASVTFYRGVLNDKMLKKSEPVTIQRTMGVHPRFGTDKSVPYEHILTKFQFIHILKTAAA